MDGKGTREELDSTGMMPHACVLKREMA